MTDPSSLAETPTPDVATVVQHANEAIFALKRGGVVASWNPAAERLLGYSAEEIVGQHIDRLIPDDRRAEQAEIIRRLRAGEAVAAWETTRLRKDGRPVDVRLSVGPIRDAQDELTGFAVIAEDISERKRAEAALRESEERLRLATQTSGFGFYDYDARRDASFWTPELYSISGLAPGTPVTLDLIASLTHPDDREHVTAGMRAALAPEGSGEFAGEFRIIRPDTGETRWLFNRSQSQFAGEGHTRQAIRNSGVVVDITDRVRAAEALRASEELTRRIADVAPSILYVYDLMERRNIWGNRELLAVLGYTADAISAMAGEILDTLLHPDDLIRYQHHAKRLSELEDGEVAELEYRMRRVDGSWRWLHSRDMVFRRGSDGQVLQVVGAALDITERKRTEDVQRLLADASALLGAPLEAPARLESLARLVVPSLADFAMIDVLDDAGVLRRVGVVHRDKAGEAILRDIAQRYPAGSAARHPILQVLLSGKPILHSQVPPALLDTIAIDPEHRRLLDRLEPVSLIRVPLLAHERRLGVLSLWRAAGAAAYTLDDLWLAQELAGRASLALDNARLFAEVDEKAERYRLALLATHDAIWDWDPITDTSYWSDTLRTLVGYSPEEARAGEGFWAQHVHPDDREALHRSLATALEGQETFWSMEYRFQRADGSWAELSDRGYIVRDPDGRPIRMIGAITDVTERNELLNSERSARAEAEAAVHARDQFLSIAAHELLTPITALKGQTQLLQRALQRGAVEENRLRTALAALNASADRLTTLTRDLLDVARLRTGRMPMRPCQVDLAELIEQCIHAARDQIQDRYRISVVIAPAVGHVVADPERLEQVLGNLLGNALKYSPDGGEIHVEAQPDGGGVLLRVIDAGIGLPAGSEEAIFQPFGRAANAERQAIQGMGLGLYICRQIAEQHGGWLRAASAGEGQGATLSLWLPA